MYFLRRRHGRKPQSDQRRNNPPVAVQPAALPIYAEPEENVSPRPVVITKARKARPELTEVSDCKPAGTFRAGTLHIPARADGGGASHGKL